MRLALQFKKCETSITGNTMCDAHFLYVKEFNISGSYLYKYNDTNPVGWANNDLIWYCAIINIKIKN